MGTEISLDIGGMSLDWAKNHRGADHGSLFQTDDHKRIHSDQIDYDNIDPADPELSEMEMGFARNLGDLVPRLELLGFKLNRVEQEYRRAVETCLDEKKYLYKYSDDHSYSNMSFTEFREFVLMYPINELDDTFIRSIEMESGQPIKSFIFDEVDVKRIPDYKGYHVSTNSERSYPNPKLENEFA